MKLKLDDKGNVVVQDGKPVYIHDDGKEVAFDAAATVATISRLNGEAKGHREAKEAAEAKLKAFDGIEDPAAALTALKTVKNIDDKKLVDAGKVEEVRAAAVAAVEEKYKPIVAERDTLKGQLNNEMIGGSFARSKFIADKVAIPSDLLQSRFGQNFEIKDGKIVAKDASGNPIYSRAKPGEIADFDEALEVLIDAYPQKNHILKGSGAGGGGAANKGGGAGEKTIKRDAFFALAPADQMAKSREGVVVVD